MTKALPETYVVTADQHKKRFITCKMQEKEAAKFFMARMMSCLDQWLDTDETLLTYEGFRN